jgi:hypothetical protein
VDRRRRRGRPACPSRDPDRVRRGYARALVLAIPANLDQRRDRIFGVLPRKLSEIMPFGRPPGLPDWPFSHRIDLSLIAACSQASPILPRQKVVEGTENFSADGKIGAIS